MNGYIKLFLQRSVLIGFAGAFGLESARLHHHFTEHHIGVVNEILVHSYAILIFIKEYPIGFDLDHSISFLQDQNIRCYLRAGIAFKGVVRQPDRTKQLGSLCDIPAHLRALLIHRAFGSDKAHHAARSQFIKRLGKEIIVYEKVVFIVSFIGKGIVAEGHIAYNGVKEAVRQLRLFKRCVHN